MKYLATLSMEQVKRMLKKEDNIRKIEEVDKAEGSKHKSLNVTCYKCKKIGHVKKNCPEKKKQGKVETNALKDEKSIVATWDDSSASSMSKSPSSPVRKNVCLMAKQMKANSSSTLSMSSDSDSDSQVSSDYDSLSTAYNELVEYTQNLVQKYKTCRLKLSESTDKISLLEKEKSELNKQVECIRDCSSSKDSEINDLHVKIECLERKLDEKKSLEVSDKFPLTACNDTYEELMRLKNNYDMLKSRLHSSEKHVTELENQNAILDMKCKDVLKHCEEKDFEIQFFKTEIERLNLKLKERSHSPPPYEKIISSSQKGSKGLGYMNHDKGKKVMSINDPSSDPELKMKGKWYAGFTKAKVSYEKEMIVNSSTSKANMHASKRKQIVNPSSSMYVHASKANTVKTNHAWMYNKNNSRTQSKHSSFYYKTVPTNPKGPKRRWVPKDLIIPVVDVVNRKVQLTGSMTYHWVIGSFKGEQVYVPRPLCC